MQPTANTASAPRILYCRCAYARVVPNKVKDAVLEALAASGADFEAVPDLCEMSARKDKHLLEIAQQGPVKIAACYPRAVRWLFSAAGAPLNNEHAEILNMREAEADDIVREILPARKSSA
jgi:hypothetical protein